MISFPGRQILCVFPDKRSDLPQAILELKLDGNSPVIVLIGGEIDKRQAEVTRQAVQTISKLAEDMHAIIICGGTDMGVMTQIARMRLQKHYTYPLIGVALEALATWPGGPRCTNFLWWGRKRWQLEPNYSHFILVPGDQFGDESPWIVAAAAILSKGHRAVTILVNGGEVLWKDIQLSLEKGRPVPALSRTGSLADKLSRQPYQHKLITMDPASAEKRIVEIGSLVPLPTLASSGNYTRHLRFSIPPEGARTALWTKENASYKVKVP
jgi:hypothetical protein